MKWILDRKKSTEPKPLLGNAPNTERMREGQPSALNENTDNFRSKIKQQTDDLSIKDEQLKQSADKQKRSEEQIHIRTKAMDAVTDGIFIIDAIKPNFPFIYANQ